MRSAAFLTRPPAVVVCLFLFSNDVCFISFLVSVFFLLSRSAIDERPQQRDQRFRRRPAAVETKTKKSNKQQNLGPTPICVTAKRTIQRNGAESIRIKNDADTTSLGLWTFTSAARSSTLDRPQSTTLEKLGNLSLSLSR